MAKYVDKKPAPLRWFLSTLFLMIAIAVGVTAYFATNQQRAPHSLVTEELIAMTADYTDPDNWAVRPVTEPMGGWEEIWGVDVVVLATAPAQNISDWYRAIREQVDLVMAASEFSNQFVSPDRLALYAPLIREPSAYAEVFEFNAGAVGFQINRADISAVLDQYFESDNRARGVVFLVSKSLLPALEAEVTERFSLDPTLLDRFAGVVVLPSGGNGLLGGGDEVEFSTDIQCSRLIELDCTVISEISFKQFLIGDEESVAALYESLSERGLALSVGMTENLNKPAPPLPPMEAIEIAPVNRPGETDF